MAYQSKYKGREVEEILDNALLKKKQTFSDIDKKQVKENLGIKDPDLSDYATKEELEDAIEKIPIPDVSGQIASALVDYVKKVEGKGLSTNDFTNELKERLEGIVPFDPSELEGEVNKLETAFNTLVSGNAGDAIESFNEIIAFLSEVSDKETLGGIIAGISKRIEEVTSDIPTKVSELENDANYLKEHQDISRLATKTEMEDAIKQIHGKASRIGVRNMNVFLFATEEDKRKWLEDGSETWIDSEELQLVDKAIQMASVGGNNPYFTTKQDKAVINVSWKSVYKSVASSEYSELIEDAVFTAKLRKEGSTEWIVIDTGSSVTNGNNYSIDIKKFLAIGANQLIIEAKGSTSKAEGQLLVTANLTSMYLAPANFVWYKPFIENEEFSLGGMNIGGNISKKVRVRISNGKGFSAEYEDNIGSSTYITSTYQFRKLAFPSAGTGTYEVDIWLDANGLESDHLVYNIMCISQADKNTAQSICINEIAKAVNGVDSELFRYSVYDRGIATASPTISIEKNGVVWKEETLVDVPTSSSQSYAAALEFEDENPLFSIFATGTLGSSSQTAEIVVDNSAAFPSVSGASFYLNAVSRSNAQADRESIINEVNGKKYSATWTNVAWVDGTDGWTVDSEGRKCLLLPASCMANIAFQPLASMGTGMTFELCYRVKNAADYNENIITIASNPTATNFQGIQIKPKKVTVHSRDLKDDDKQSYPLQDEELVHVIVTIIKNYKTNYGNLCQIYVNGGKRCSFEFSSTDSFATNANILLGSSSADLYIYKMRKYDWGFEWISAAQNFVNCLTNQESKRAAWSKIIDAMDDSYRVDYEKVAGRRNTMVIEMKDGAILPSLMNPAGGYCDFWVNIVDQIPSELDEDFKALLSGIIIENQFIEGQGTTAMTYFRWNFRWKLDKLYNKRRITAKKNVASSMQDHKMGATRLYNDFHNACVGLNELGTRVAVFQYPVYGFLKEKIEGTEDQYTYTFIGLYTIGPDKGDKPYFGFNDPRVESTLMHLEGTDHTPTGVGMEYPWDELRFDASKEAIGGILNSTTIEAAWEVGAAGELEPDSASDQQSVQNMLNNEFKPAYKAAYDCSTFIEGVSQSLSSINTNPISFRNAHSGKEVWTDGVYDLYYYNIQYKEYRSNGVNLLTQLGISASELSGKTIAQKNEIFKAKRRAKFVADMGKTWHQQDAIFHYVFCLIFAATDNFKKNTYPYKYYPLAQGGLWRWRQDDLDSILDINNQGFSAKSYSTLVGDVTATGSGSVFRGDNSVFWTLIKECFPDEIKAMVHLILDKMIEMAPSGQTKLERCVSYFKSLFWDKAQEYFGEGSYNVDAEWTYEEAWYQRTLGNYTNDVHPLQQSLGSHYEAEKDWVTLRFAFLMSYYSYGAFSTDSGDDTSMGQISFRATGGKTYKITPALDFNPTILVGQSSMVSAEDRIKAGNTVNVIVPDMGSNDTHIYIQGTDYYSSIGDLADLTVSADNPVLTVSSKRLRSLKVGDVTASKVSSNVATLTIGACPSLETIDARNLTSLRSAVNLTQCTRLKEVLFGGTQSPNVMIPTGSKLHTLSLPSTITTLSLMKLRNLQNLIIDGLSSIGYLRLEENPNVDNFAMLKRAYQESDGLTNIRVIGFDDEGETSDIDMLADIAEKCKGIDAEGNATSDIAVIEGKLTVPYAYRDSCDKIESTYPNLTINVEKDYYVRFADPEVARVLISNLGDGVGVTETKVKTTTDIGTIFKGNTEIKTFDELAQFEKLTTLEDNYFDGCTNLENINIVNIKKIEPYTFRNCVSLKANFDLPNLISLEMSAFEQSGIVSLSAINLNALASFCFWSCSNLNYVNLPNAVSIGTASFSACVNLMRAEFNKVQNCSNAAFKGCTNLEELILGSMENASSEMCKDCTSLKEVKAYSLKTIGQSSFADCPSLEIIDLSKVTSIGTDGFSNCSLLKNINLNNCQTLGVAAFQYTALGDVELPRCTGNLSYTFRGSSITSIKMPFISALSQAFYECRQLKYVEVGLNITEIGSYAFYYCILLQTFICRATTPPALNSNAFRGADIVEIYVPDESVEDYKTAANWSSLAERIKPLSEYEG